MYVCRGSVGAGSLNCSVCGFPVWCNLLTESRMISYNPKVRSSRVNTTRLCIGAMVFRERTVIMCLLPQGLVYST